MRFPSHLTPAFLLVATVTACAPARGPSPLEQEAAYARTPGETLYYREVIRSSSRTGLGMPAPDAEVSRAVHAARVAIRFTDGNRAQVWLESPPNEMPGDPVEPPFTARMGPRGIDSVAAAAGLRLGGSGAKDQIRDFFPRLPGGPLAHGRAWNDAATRDLSDEEWTGTQTRTVHYRVVGSGVIDGERVVVAEYELLSRSQRRSRRSLPYESGMPSFPPAGESTYQQERGRIYFAPRTGRFVRRRGSGVWEQSRSVHATEAAVQVSEYTSTTDLVPSQSP